VRQFFAVLEIAFFWLLTAMFWDFSSIQFPFAISPHTNSPTANGFNNLLGSIQMRLPANFPYQIVFVVLFDLVIIAFTLAGRLSRKDIEFRENKIGLTLNCMCGISLMFSFLSLFMMIMKRITNVNWDNVDVSEGKTVTSVHVSFAMIYCTLCYIWKILVPQLRYVCGARQTSGSDPKNLESGTVNKNDEEEKTEPSSCTIDIGTLEKDVSTAETSEINSNCASEVDDSDKTEKEPPKYSELNK